MALEKELKDLDVDKLSNITSAVLSQLDGSSSIDFFKIEDAEYPALAMLAYRSSAMYERIKAMHEAGEIEDNEQLYFMRGLNVGMWVVVAALHQYVQTEKFEAETSINPKKTDENDAQT